MSFATLITLLQVKDASKVWYFNPKLIGELEMTVEQITNKSNFSNDLGLDSLDTVEVVMAIEEVPSPSKVVLGFLLIVLLGVQH